MCHGRGGSRMRAGRPGSDLLSRALRQSTISAASFHGRVRNGVGWGTCAIATRSSCPHAFSSCKKTSILGLVLLLFGIALRDGRPCAFAPVLVKPVEGLVPVSCTHYCASTSGLSTWWSATPLIAIPGFEGGFPLRCFQRLSRPHLATRRCRWRDNRYTRGASIPVLSY